MEYRDIKAVVDFDSGVMSVRFQYPPKFERVLTVNAGHFKTLKEFAVWLITEKEKALNIFTLLESKENIYQS